MSSSNYAENYAQNAPPLNIAAYLSKIATLKAQTQTNELTYCTKKCKVTKDLYGQQLDLKDQMCLGIDLDKLRQMLWDD